VHRAAVISFRKSVHAWTRGRSTRHRRGCEGPRRRARLWRAEGRVV